VVFDICGSVGWLPGGQGWRQVVDVVAGSNNQRRQSSGEGEGEEERERALKL